MSITNISENTVGIFGLGYIGLPFTAALASVGFDVIGCDVDKEKIRNLKKTYRVNIHEPGLNETFERFKDRIKFTTDEKELMNNTSKILVTVGTPLKNDRTPDYNSINSCIESIGKNLKKEQLIIFKSTVVPGTTEEYVAPKLKELSGLEPGKDFYLAYSPERTIEGMALYEIYNLPKIVGGINQESTNRAASVLEKLGGSVIKVSCTKVAEICKITDNLYRATNIALANELGMICEKNNIDAHEVVNAVNNAYERTKIFTPGLGADGPCLTKDPEILRYHALQKNVEIPIIEHGIKMNNYATLRIADIVSDFIERNNNKVDKISFLGLAFKGHPETDDVRGSPAISIYNKLKDKIDNMNVGLYDPLVKRVFDKDTHERFEDSINDANIVMLLTNHKKLMNIDVKEILEKTKRPLLIVDCWHNLKGVENLNEEGVEVFRIGHGWMKNNK